MPTPGMCRHHLTAPLLSFVYHWQDFLDPLIYLSDFTTYPVSLGLRMYQSMAETWANLLMATSLIALVPVVIVFFLCERYVMRGRGVVGGIHNLQLGTVTYYCNLRDAK